ncbi:VapE domain-containing protein [Empedobacter falsenii]|uniref:VapE domain-containing protein n=1 Tax=Empedobacter falsenii TaxID=343874 RepID=UPI001C57E583|nr:VapE domain-containing protein [Empedobacter falsenii]MBW1619858.1 virulence-associated E family protein [Empedobacter falsenii]
MKFTLFQNFNEVINTVPIEQIVTEIKEGTYKSQILYLRKSLEQGKMEPYEKAKKSLIAFTPSATFKGGRKLDYLQNYNQIIVLDIDKVEKNKLAEIKQKAIELSTTFVAFISPSNNGLKLFIKVSTNQEEHKITYNNVKEFYEKELEIEIDKSGKDITRLCFYSYDPEIYFNPNAEVFSCYSEQNCHFELVEKSNSVSHPELVSGSHNTNKSNSSNLNTTDLLYDHCVRFTKQKMDYAEGNRNNFVHQLACNLNRKGISYAEALGFILSDYNYNEIEVMNAVKSAYNNTHEFGTDKEYKTPKTKEKTNPKSSSTNEEEIDDDEEKPAAIERLEMFLNKRYNFRYNIVTGKLEYKKVRNQMYKPITDFVENSILREVLKAKVKCSIQGLRYLLLSDYVEQFDPFKDYFSTLPEINQEVDYITELANTITTTNQELWLECFKKWFVAMVACVTNEKVVNQTVIVFSGKQGIGKTTWMEKLVPKPLKDYLFSGTINPNNKDTLIHLAECMLINLDELENLNKTEIGSLKEIITKSHIRMRKAYGHNNETLPRRASFAGSVNTAQFLNDTTGSRRFLCFEVEHIEYHHSVNLDNCYKQALHLIEEGFRYWFNNEEIKNINHNNEQYQIKSPEEELLLTWFEKADRETATAFLNTTQIATRLAYFGNIAVNNSSINQLGKALRKLGFLRIVKSNNYVYCVREKEYDEVQKENKISDE